MEKKVLFDLYFRDFVYQMGIYNIDEQKAKGAELCEKFKDASDLEFIKAMYEKMPELKYMENLHNRYRLKRIDNSLFFMRVIIIISIAISVLAGIIAFFNSTT